MKKVLYIKANFKSDENSHTNKISNSFVEFYKKYHESDEIDTLDLYKINMPHLSAKDFYDSTNETGYLVELANKFKSYDKFIFSAPMWNLTIPSILVAYLDYVVAPHITFEYDSFGKLVGLLKDMDKKTIYIGTRGGFYKNTFLESLACDDVIVKNNMAMVGIDDFTSYIVEGIEACPDKLEDMLNVSITELDKIAKEF